MPRPSSQKRRPAILATSVAVLFSLGFLLGAQKARADQYWDGSNTGSGTSNGQGGDGPWDLTTTNWVDSSGNNPHIYDPTQTSIFGNMGGTITLGNDISFSALQFNVDGYIVNPGSGPFKLSAQSGTGTISAASGVTVTFNTQLTGTGVMSFQGNGTINLTSATSASNDYSGGTVIGSGGAGPTLVINVDSDLGAAGSAIVFDGGTLQTTATIATSRPVVLSTNSSSTLAPAGSTTLELDGQISGQGTLVISGSGTVQLANSTNSYTGGTVISSGALVISADGDLGGSGSNITFSGGGSLRTSASVATFRSITLNTTGTLTPAIGTTFEIAGQISGSGGLNLNGDGTVMLDLNSNSYTGPTNLVSGTLIATTNNAFSPSSTMTIGAGATLALNGWNQTVASLDGGGTVSTSGGTLTTGGNGLGTTYTGVIQGGGGLTKTGTGTMLLTGLNTYTGRTTVAGGKLVVDTSSTTEGLSESSTLVLAGGAYQQNGFAGNAVTQILNGLVVNSGQNQIIVNNLGTTTTLDLRGTNHTAGIIHNGGAVDFSILGGTIGITAAGASALIMTHQANDATGIIGAWATVNGGAGFAVNDGSDHIVAYDDSAYSNIAARGAVVPNGTALNVRINSAGTTGPDTLAATTTNINTLSQNTGTDSTIDLAGGILRVGTSGGILITPSGANLTIGTTGNPGTLTAGGGTDNTAGQITLNNSSTASLLTINSVIANNGTGVVSVTIAGTKTTAFANANTYTGATILSGGTLRLDVANALPSQTGVFINSGATLDLNNNAVTVGSISDGTGGGGTISLGSATLTVGTSNTTASYSGKITGAGSLVKTGTGTLTLSNTTSNYTGGTTLNSGRLNVNGTAALGAGTLTINGGTIGTTVAGGQQFNNSVVVGGSFSVATNVDSSSAANQNLNFGGPVNLGSSGPTITGVTPGGQVTFSNVLSGSNGVTFTTTSAVNSDGSSPYVAFIYASPTANTYTGTTTVKGNAILAMQTGTPFAGVIALQGDADVEENGVLEYIGGAKFNDQIADSATVTVNSKGNTILGGLHFDGLELRGASDTIKALNGAGTVGLGSGTLTVGEGNFSGVIEDGAFVGTSGGSLVKNTLGTLILSGANTYTGTTSITQGTLQAGATNTLSSGSVVNISTGATLDMNGFSQSVSSITGTGNITMGAGTLTVGGTNASSTFSGAISGTGGVTKIGTGTLTLSGTSTYTYTGPTTVKGGGKLIVAPTGATAVLSNLSGLVVGGTTANDGGFFQLNGITGTATSQQVNGLTVNAGSNVVAVNNTDLTTTTTLSLGSITRNANGFVDFRATALNSILGGDAIILTTQANDASGILGAWATVNNGSDLATNQGGKIVGLSSVAGGYQDIAFAQDTVPNGANLNVRINKAVATSPTGNPNDIIASHPVTSINTLTQNFTSASTIELAGGTLKLGADGGILITPNSASLTIGAASNDGVLTATSSSSVPATITLANNSAVGTLTINSAITEAGGGPLSVRLTGTGTTVFAGTNTYTGTTAILTGTLRTDADNALGINSTVTINSGATLNLNGHTQTVGSIADGPGGGGIIALGAATGALTTGTNNTSTSFSGAITGTGSLIKVGTGTLTLSGTSTYSGGTTLTGGGLTVNSNSAIGTGTLTIAPSTPNTVTLGSTVNNTTLTNAVALKGDVSVFTSGSGQNFFLNGNVDLNGGTRTLTGLTNGGQVQFGGTISNGGVTLNTSFTNTGDYVAFIYNGSNTYTGTTTVNNGAFLVFQGQTPDGGVKGDVLIQGNGVVDYLAGSGTGSSQIADTATVTVNSGGNTASGQFFGGLDLFTSSGDTIGTLNGSVNGVVSLGAANLTIGAGNFAGIIFDGTHSGYSGGQITKTGSGTLFLSGTNFYTGGTNINGGILKINSDQSLGNSNGALNFGGGTLEIAGTTVSNRTVTLNANATVQVDDGVQGEWDGVIHGSGNLTKTGPGDLFITNTSNDFSGSTFVNGGQLLLSGQLLHPVTVNNSATFVLQTGGTLSTGAGTTPVIVNNGGTFSNFGNLAITGAGSVGTHLTGSGATVINQEGAVLSADKGVLVNNTSGIGTVVNLGKITGTGGVAVDALTSSGIWIGDFGTFTGAVKMGTGQNTVVIATSVTRTPISAPNGKNDTLRLVGGGLDTLNLSQFSGYEFLDKAGGGQWNLTGTNPFSGGTLVEAGTLNVTGNLISNTKINLDGSLTGTGIVTGNVVNFGAVVPGVPTAVITSTNTPGRLTLKGNYRQDATGTLAIQLDGAGSNQFSQLAISGRAQLAGGLLIRNDGNVVSLKLGQKLTFLTADSGVSGKFATVEGDIPTGTVVVGKVVYDANSVSIQGTQGSFRSINNEFHLTANQNAVAAALDSAAPDPRADKLINFLDRRPLKKLPGDFDQIAPEEMASVYRLGVSLSDVQARNVQRRTADVRAGTSGFSAAGFQTTGSPNYSGGLAGANGPDGKDGKTVDTETERRWGTFITGVGDFAHVGDSGNARGYDLNTGGVTVGADYKLTSHVAIGVIAGYAGTNANLPDDGRLLVNSGRAGVYGTYYTGGYYADAAVTGGVTNYSTRRSSLEGVASGSTAGGSVDVLVATGYDWRLDALTIGPTASFQYTYVGIEGFTEHGSLTPLRYAGQHQTSYRSTLGLHAAYDWKLGNVLVRPEMTLAWQHEYGDRSYSIESALASGAGDAFTVSDTQIGRDSLLFGAGVAVLWNPRTSTYLYYDADLLKKEYNSQSVSGGLRMNF